MMVLEEWDGSDASAGAMIASPKAGREGRAAAVDTDTFRFTWEAWQWG